MNSQIKKFIKKLICVALVVFVILFITSYSGVVTHANKDFLHMAFSCFSKTVTITMVFAYLFDKWIWKWKYVNKIFDVPILASSYACTFISDYDGKERKATLKIKQSFFRISVTFKTEESDSGSVIDAQIQDLDNRKRLIYTYLNTPKANILDKSPIHYGTTILDISDSQKIEGDYFTIRKTKGHIECKAIKSPIA